MQKIENDVSLETLRERERERERESNNLVNKVNRIEIVNKTSLLPKKVIGF